MVPSIDGLSKSEIASILKLYRSGSYADAAKEAKDFLQSKPENKIVWQILGASLKYLGFAHEALKAMETAVKLSPSDPAGLSNLGCMLQDLGQTSDAIKCHEKAIKINPLFAEAQINLGNAYFDVQRYTDAASCFTHAISINPDLENAHFNLANTLKVLGDLQGSKHSFMKCIEKNPKNFEAYCNLGNVCLELREIDEAICCYEQSISINNRFSDAYYNLGKAHFESGNLEQAKLNYQKSIDIDPNHVDSYCNLANTLRAQCNYELARRNYEFAINIDPNHINSNWNLGLLDLVEGRYNTGWHGYEFGFLNGQRTLRYNQSKPLWSPTHIMNSTCRDRGKPILLWGEQGVGDDLMFSKMLHFVLQTESNIIAQVDSRLVPLFERSFPEGVKFASNTTCISESDYASHLSLGSLPKYYVHSRSDIEQVSHFRLKTDRVRRESLDAKLQKQTKKTRIGISWRSFSSKSGRLRSIDLADLVQAFDSERFGLVNLQYGNIDDEVSQCYSFDNREIIQLKHEVDCTNDIDGLAALIDCCDLIVTIDNFTAHLAGSLGKPTWVLLPCDPDWRWHMDTDRSPWYPTIRLFRQDRIGSWTGLLNELHRQLDSLD